MSRTIRSTSPGLLLPTCQSHLATRLCIRLHARKREYFCVALCVVLAGIAFLSGCRSAELRTETLPPIATLSTQMHGSNGDSGRRFRVRGQAIWIGDRVLTAGHNVIRSEGPVETVYLNGRPVDVESDQSGDPFDIARIVAESDASELRIRDPFEVLSRWSQDWALIRVNETRADAAEMLIADAPAKPGETLWLVGVEPHGDSEGMVFGLPLEVVKLTIHREDDVRADPPEGVFLTKKPRDDMSGWSGGFVGRHKPREDVWEYVGIMVGTVQLGDELRSYSVVVQPPTGVLRELLDGEK